MFKKILATVLLAVTAFSVHAGMVWGPSFVITDFQVVFDDDLTMKDGGDATIFYRDNVNAIKKFDVKVSPYENTFLGLGITEDWITPVEASGYTFEAVDLYWMYKEIMYDTSVGLTFASWPVRGVNFTQPLAYLTVREGTEVVSTVPEPGSLALLGLGILGITATRKRKKV